ncbi:hypothetical protein Q8A67_025615 [Cirrhinus molitorella]|uniref:Secreted protein n=1 Tax=Cirrhinus molitorella TaxID=172907 RepID=A0AA88P8R9_9TELE|nr:hypothetical protein Q8A67_025615 [Cirrhinus molitorella]
MVKLKVISVSVCCAALLESSLPVSHRLKESDKEPERQREKQRPEGAGGGRNFLSFSFIKRCSAAHALMPAAWSDPTQANGCEIDSVQQAKEYSDTMNTRRLSPAECP